MSLVPSVLIHESCWPQASARDLLRSLRTRRIPHKFHYESYKQARQWLALHETYSPARRDPDCRNLYDRALSETAASWNHKSVHLLALGCGGGQKEVALLQELNRRNVSSLFTPQDVSLPLVLTAWQRARQLVEAIETTEASHDGLLCDLAGVTEPQDLLARLRRKAIPRLVTFLGLAPNFEPHEVWPQLSEWIGEDGRLLFSANLAPGADYEDGVRQLLPSYANDMTNRWLTLLLEDWGLERGDGEVRWSVEPCPHGTGLLRIAADYHPIQKRRFEVEGESVRFEPGQPWRLFFSYRHTPECMRDIVARNGLRLINSWITDSGEEGVFLCERL